LYSDRTKKELFCSTEDEYFTTVIHKMLQNCKKTVKKM